MALTNLQKQQLSAATVTMFGAPSGGYSSFLESALESAGGNLATVMANLANLDAFKSQYAGSHDAIATKMAAV